MTKLLARDHERMQGVHPHLVRVVIEARKAAPFIVLEGLRSRERHRRIAPRRRAGLDQDAAGD